MYAFGGANPELISNPIKGQIYNDSGGGIVGGTFDLAPGLAFRNNYLLSVGAITDELTDETLSNAVLNYDYQLDQWANYNLANLPTALGSYTDAGGTAKLIFGDSGGQCYTYGGTATSDNGTAIESIAEYVHHGGVPEIDKDYKYIWLFFNPGCQAKCQVAITDTYTKEGKKWIDLGAAVDGVVEFRFPEGSTGKLLFVKVYESSRHSKFVWYGMAVDYDAAERR